MNYCSACGSSNIVFEIPRGDTRSRYICQDCDLIFYENPKIVTGCILEWEQKILLCKRSIEPKLGMWTIPAGFMENHESVLEAATRELMEEACATATGLRLHGIYNLKYISQVYIIYYGKLKEGRVAAGEETFEVGLYEKEKIPWEKVAFPVVSESLNRYLEDCSIGEMKLHSIDMDRNDNGEVIVIKRQHD